MERIALVSLLALSWAVGCTRQATVDVEAERQALRELDGQFGALAAKKDSVGAAGLYADDAVVMAPNAPAVKGAAAIRALWASLVQTPGLVLRVEPERIDVSPQGDFASDMGTVTIESDGPQGRATEVSKYVEVWRKQDGKWRVVYDIWNSNAPPAPAPPPAQRPGT
jgi:ketosteroid isomerase-like protein